MNNCYIDLPELELPWSVDELFCDEDYNIINDDNSHLRPYMIKTDRLVWNNWQAQDGGEASWMYDNIITPDNKLNVHFNGTALITNTKLKREVYDWARDTFHKDYLDELWGVSPNAAKFPPISILCFNKTSAWHSEGPIEIPNDIPVDFSTKILRRVRASICCNFRLLGDEDDSILQFTHASDELNKMYRQLEHKFVYKWFNNKRFNNKWFNNNSPNPEYIVRNGLKVSPSTSYIVDTEKWKKHIPISVERKGMHCPFFININKWHRVLTNNTPRVSFRVHSGDAMNFRKVEELVSSGNFFK